MSVLVDTSIWIDYFRNGHNSNRLDYLIDKNHIVINSLILAELTPFLKIRNQRKLIALLHQIFQLPMVINWEQIIQFQYECLRHGINGVGIPDLLLVQNAKQNHCKIYSLDNHFKLMKDILKIDLFN